MQRFLTSKELVFELVSRVPELKPLYDEHISDFDELLPHLFFGDVTRYVAQHLRIDDSHSLSSVVKALNVLEEGMVIGDDKAQELISVSFLENLVNHDDVLVKAQELMGPNLTKELKAYL